MTITLDDIKHRRQNVVIEKHGSTPEQALQRYKKALELANSLAYRYGDTPAGEHYWLELADKELSK